MSSETLNLSSELYKYYQSVAFREPQILTKLRHETQTRTGAAMQISPEQGQFMTMLVSLLKPRRILEIGTFTGYSAIAMGLALVEEGKLLTCDIDPHHTTIAKRYWAEAGLENKIELHLRPALETLHHLLSVEQQESSFDLIFIDGDKNNYPHYYEQCLQLLKPGALMLIDNVLWSGTVADANNPDQITKMFRALNQKIKNDTRIMVSMLPIGDGLTMVRKN